MALTYDGSNGLFTRLGKIIYLVDLVRTHQASIVTEIGDIKAEYSSTDSYMVAAIGDAERHADAAGAILFSLRQAAIDTLVEMCYAEASTTTTNPMRSKTLPDALVWLVRQMSTDAERIKRNTLSKGSTTYGASNNGNGIIVCFLECPNILFSNTENWPNIRDELIDVRCTADAQNGVRLSGSEVFEVRGQPSFANLDRRFPAGSGMSMQMISTSGSVDAGARYENIGFNCDLEDATSNVPDNWTVSSGTAGTDFLSETTTVYRGSRSLKAAATGTTWKIRQQLSSLTGSQGALTPDRPYVLSFAAKIDAGATGTIELSVEDSGGTVIGGGTFKLTVAHGALTTSWVRQSIAVFSPRVLPTDAYIVLETTVGVATAAMYIDDIVIAEMQQFGPAGPYLSILAGSAAWNRDDFGTVDISNSLDGKFATAFDRLFDMKGQSIALPDATGTNITISDSLIA